MIIEDLEWNVYLKKKKSLIEYGIKTMLIQSYSDDVIGKLRNIYCDGIPASIILLSNFLCSGFCYDMAMLITLAFSNSNFKIIDANIDGITLNPKYKSKYKDRNKTNHRFVERINEDGIHMYMIHHLE